MIRLPRLKRRLTPVEVRRSLIRLESDAVGRYLFGEVPAGHEREFYCLDDHTWVWREQWAESGRDITQTVRYEVRPDGIIKNVDGVYKKLDHNELENLKAAMRIYHQAVKSTVYGYGASQNLMIQS
ncbi:MAG: hypothetical protein LBK50_03050 [Candidatus Nomurabacteria bacterium]|jgi:hypothetical protein|nr:hypothetical protein [Candidatus Nomurabacteria bacterium]